MPEPVHPEAAGIWNRELADRRLLVLGASGWFGRTAMAMSEGLPVLAVGSRARTFRVLDREIRCEAWDEERILEFAPTDVVDCAFLTRDRVTSVGLGDYVAMNRELTSRARWTTRLDSVHRLLTISSGAAVHPVDALTTPLEQNPYGFLKREAEEQLRTDAEETGCAIAIVRAWSVSGPFVRIARSYALSDMVLQARKGRIAIRADHPVLRRYVAVEDLLAVGLSSAQNAVTTVDSGGRLVEMSELAELVSEAVGGPVEISRPPLVDTRVDDYAAEPEIWSRAAARAHLVPRSLEQQLAAVAQWLPDDAVTN
ncbi:MAG: NAD(P)-dependent oxidoreductase [Gordonia polyisoprenivorans]|nr:NAD(P)-dependent oxidoreductase [Gordonia polyisoprenivorans]